MTQPMTQSASRLGLVTAPRRSEASYPAAPTTVPPGELHTRRYTLRFAKTPRELEKVQRLRFSVFNEELNEGLEISYVTGRDIDPFDTYCHHLMVVCRQSDEVVGTYRLMTQQTAGGRDFYSATEYALSDMPRTVLAQGVEAGRACVDAEHRNGRVVQLLWRGIARYMAHNDKRFLFGCCSVPTLDAGVVYRLRDELEVAGQLDETIRLSALPHVHEERPDEGTQHDNLLMPPLMVSYLRLGARVVSEPAFDHDFGVTDFLVLLDLRAMDKRALERLMRTNDAWDVAASPRSA